MYELYAGLSKFVDLKKKKKWSAFQYLKFNLSKLIKFIDDF